MLYRNAFLSVNGTDVSAYLESLDLPLTRDALDNTAMGANTKTNEAGLKGWKITANFHQSFAAAELDSILFPLFNNGTTFAIVCRPDTGAKGTSNPEFTGNGFIANYTPLTGKVGTHLSVPITIEATGDLSRATS